jgi:competence protein ComEC
MPILLLVVLLVPLLAGCLPGGARSDGVPSADAPFTLTAMDVGQGDAVLLRTPSVTVLVDTGEPDAGVTRLLAREGVARLDLLVISHPHLDHVGGAPDVLAALPVDVVWLHAPPPDVELVPQVAQLLREAELRGIPVRAPPQGALVQLDDLLIEVLGPPPGRPYAWARSELNESSIVLRASVEGAGSVLIAGDAERAAQADLLATAGTGVAADVLVVPHHGSRTNDPEFLVAVGARVAVISAGRGNRHGHPHPEVVELLERTGARVLRTDRDGTVQVRVGR